MAASLDLTNQRAEQLTRWRTLQRKRDEHVAAALRHGASEQAAHAAATRQVRGEVRRLIDDLFAHLREPQARAFVRAAPREWGVRTELLLDLDPLVSGLIAQSTGTSARLPLATAERDPEWTARLVGRMQQVGEGGAQAVEHVFGGARAVRQSAAPPRSAVELPETEAFVEQTKNYRADRLAIWRKLQASHADYLGRLRKAGAPAEVAAESAARVYRGDVNVFIDELLTHLREQQVKQFLTTAPRGWGRSGEILLDADPLVPAFIAESFPVIAWSVALDESERATVQRAIAAENEGWMPWLGKRIDRVGDLTEKTVDHVFAVVKPVAQGVGDAIGDVGEGVGDAIGDVGEGVGGAVGDVGEGLGDVGKGLGSAIETAAIIGTSVLAVGVVVIGGIWVLRGDRRAA